MLLWVIDTCFPVEAPQFAMSTSSTLKKRGLQLCIGTAAPLSACGVLSAATLVKK